MFFIAAVLLSLFDHVSASSCGESSCDMSLVTAGAALLQRQNSRHKVLVGRSKTKVFRRKLKTHPARFAPRVFLGANPVANTQPCEEDLYLSSELERNWSLNVEAWTKETHCDHMSPETVSKWVYQNEHGNFDLSIFPKTCRKGKVPQYIEPLAGILRDPRFQCPGIEHRDLFSVDWLVFPNRRVLTQGGKSRFFDAGGSVFGDALVFFLETYRGHGIIFDEVYVWEYKAQGKERYWYGVEPQVRSFWEPRLWFYDGIGVTAEKNHRHNPVHRIFTACEAKDFCAFKLDIDTPQIELPLVQQLLDAPRNTMASLNEFFFEHHVSGVMAPWWGSVNVSGTFADSYKIFSRLRGLGVRAHSWV
jgi:hypothetical protein